MAEAYQREAVWMSQPKGRVWHSQSAVKATQQIQQVGFDSKGNSYVRVKRTQGYTDTAKQVKHCDLSTCLLISVPASSPNLSFFQPGRVTHSKKYPHLQVLYGVPGSLAGSPGPTRATAQWHSSLRLVPGCRSCRRTRRSKQNPPHRAG